jgi:translation elongation factor EF-1beta
MDPLTILIAIAGIVATGALTKVGENATDAAFSKSNELLSRIKQKSPTTAALIEGSDQHPLDYGKAYLQVEAIAKDNSDITRLLEETKELVLLEPKVAEKVEQELNRANPQLSTVPQLSSTVIENWKGINIKGGINPITGNTFKF